ncbi:MAG TPA: hypothetical protein VMW32_04575, partial [Bacteroidales bacterium]|nr:hypothetical protein [Bacteroidales bacterium]
MNRTLKIVLENSLISLLILSGISCSTGSREENRGTGFGVMGILVGTERGFITRDEGLEHLRKIVGFLQKADRFHGAWSH